MYKILPFPIILSLVAVSSSLTGAESDTSARYSLYDSLNFVAERLATQVINSREFDPFGLPQDPAKQLTTTIKEEGGEDDVVVVNKPQLKLQLNKLQGRVSVKDNGFFLGNRYFKVADKLNLKDGEDFFSLEVTSVRKNVIQFRDLNSNEVLKLNLKQGAHKLQKADPLPDIPLSTGDKAIEL